MSTAVAPGLELVEAERAGVPSVERKLHRQALGRRDEAVEAGAHAREHGHAPSDTRRAADSSERHHDQRQLTDGGA